MATQAAWRRAAGAAPPRPTQTAPSRLATVRCCAAAARPATPGAAPAHPQAPKQPQQQHAGGGGTTYEEGGSHKMASRELNFTTGSMDEVAPLHPSQARHALVLDPRAASPEPLPQHAGRTTYIDNAGSHHVIDTQGGYAAREEDEEEPRLRCGGTELVLGGQHSYDEATSSVDECEVLNPEALRSVRIVTPTAQPQPHAGGGTTFEEGGSRKSSMDWAMGSFD